MSPAFSALAGQAFTLGVINFLITRSVASITPEQIREVVTNFENNTLA
jgi:hypothetical protein